MTQGKGQGVPAGELGPKVTNNKHSILGGMGNNCKHTGIFYIDFKSKRLVEGLEFTPTPGTVF